MHSSNVKYVCITIKIREHNAITLQKNYSALYLNYSALYLNYSAYALHMYVGGVLKNYKIMLLHKTTDCTTQNYTKLQTNYVHTQYTHKLSCT